MEISKEEFEAYERVRKSGVTNIFAVGIVCKISGLSREKAIEIMERYGNLAEKYLDVRRD